MNADAVVAAWLRTKRLAQERVLKQLRLPTMHVIRPFGHRAVHSAAGLIRILLARREQQKTHRKERALTANEKSRRAIFFVDGLQLQI
jgi:hypothetical protein